MIEGVRLIPLKQIQDERGKVMHMLRVTDPHFKKFGEIYFSCTYPGVVKGWHKHSEMTLSYAAVTGAVKVVLFDDRVSSATKGEVQEIYLTQENYCLLVVPPFTTPSPSPSINIPCGCIRSTGSVWPATRA